MTDRLSLFNCVDVDDMPAVVDPLSDVRVARHPGGLFAVETFDWIDTRPGCGFLKARERWSGGNEGHAMLVAQWLAARGYLLVNQGRAIHA